MATDEVVRGLRDRVRRLPAPSAAPPGALETAAWLLLHRAVAFDPAVEADVARQGGVPVPALHGTGPRVSKVASAPATPGRSAAAHGRLAALAATCPPPDALLRAVDLAAKCPALTENALRETLAKAGLSEGTAGAALVRGLAALWPRDHATPVLWPSALALPRLHELADAVHAAGAEPAPCPSAVDAGWLHGQAGVIWSGGYLVAVGDARSALARPVRRQLAAVGPLAVPTLLAGASRARPTTRSLDRAGLVAWVSVQHDLTIEGDELRLNQGHDRWLLPTDRPVLALFDGTSKVTRRDLLRVLTGCGLRLRSASQ